MYSELYYNQSKCFDPTQGYVLSKLEREEKRKQAWLDIAKTMACAKPSDKSGKASRRLIRKSI